GISRRTMKRRLFSRGTSLVLLLASLTLGACAPTTEYDVILRGGTVYDGTGAVGDIGKAKAKTEVDVTGRAVAPGFVNMLSWAVSTLIQDGRSESDIRQGVTLEVFGEGTSMGPWNDEMKKTN